jgi:hypothetical protein
MLSLLARWRPATLILPAIQRPKPTGGLDGKRQPVQKSRIADDAKQRLFIPQALVPAPFISLRVRRKSSVALTLPLYTLPTVACCLAHCMAGTLLPCDCMAGTLLLTALLLTANVSGGNQRDLLECSENDRARELALTRNCLRW